MGEGTKTFNAQEEIAELKRSLGATTKPHGCICPAGAEAACKGIACPRRGYGVGVKWSAISNTK